MAEKKPSGWTVHDLWAKYEDIAMHFNDLLIRLRMQALAGVAAISTLVSIFTKTDAASVRISWEIAAGVFGGLAFFWVAIAIIDFAYYNRLLIGAVMALRKIEEESRKKHPSLAIDMSTMIELYVQTRPNDPRSFGEKFYSRVGIWSFYILVFIAIVLGFLFCLCKELGTHTPRASWYPCLCFLS